MKNKTVKRIFSYLKPYKKLLIAAIITAVAGIPLSLLCPVLIGRAIDEIIGVGNVNFNKILYILISLIAVAAISAFLTWLMNIFTRKLSSYSSRDMREDVFNNLNKLPLKEIDNRPQGDIVSRLVNDTDTVSEGLFQLLSQLLPGIITVITTIVIMLYLNLVIALVVIFVTPLSILFAKFIGKRTSKMFKRQSSAQGAVSAYVSEMVENIELVQAFSYENVSKNEFNDHNEEFFNSNFKATFYSSVINPGTRFVNAVVYAAVGTFGAIYALSGYISVGGLSAFLSYANQYTKPFNEITAVLTQLQNAIAGAERIFEIIDIETETADSINALPITSSSGNVKAENVYFSYKKDVKLIQDFNLNAKSGQRIALVGPTGCGKTTIISLLMRFYDIDSGNISIDSNNVQNIKKNNLRSLYGMVLQETWLKNASIKENIAYAKPNATMDEIIAAAKSSYAHRFIMQMPEGYNTVITSNGENLSEGQKQLLCIARIMLAKPDMLILDEATSSIDTRTELLIQKALDKLMDGHTSFIVAHRLSTIQNADNIIVMESGKIIEQGQHNQLLTNGGFYYNLYKSQFTIT